MQITTEQFDLYRQEHGWLPGRKAAVGNVEMAFWVSRDHKVVAMSLRYLNGGQVIVCPRPAGSAKSDSPGGHVMGQPGGPGE